MRAKVSATNCPTTDRNDSACLEFIVRQRPTSYNNVVSNMAGQNVLPEGVRMNYSADELRGFIDSSPHWHGLFSNP